MGSRANKYKYLNAALVSVFKTAKFSFRAKQSPDCRLLLITSAPWQSHIETSFSLPSSLFPKVTRFKLNVSLFLLFLDPSQPLTDVWVDGDGGLRSKTTVRLLSSGS